MAKQTAAVEVQDDEKQDTLPEAIRKISAGVARLTAVGLNKRAIVVLLKDSTGISKETIGNVLGGLQELANQYATPVKVKKPRG